MFKGKWTILAAGALCITAIGFGMRAVSLQAQEQEKQETAEASTAEEQAAEESVSTGVLQAIEERQTRETEESVVAVPRSDRRAAIAETEVRVEQADSAGVVSGVSEAELVTTLQERRATAAKQAQPVPNARSPRVAVGDDGRRKAVIAELKSRQDRAASRAYRALKEAETEEEEAEAKRELREALEDEYDSSLESYERQLEKLRERLKKLESELDRRREAKAELVDLRLQTLVNRANGLGWPGGGLGISDRLAPLQALQGPSVFRFDRFNVPGPDARLPRHVPGVPGPPSVGPKAQPGDPTPQPPPKPKERRPDRR